jgi:hypothetical protein
VPIRERLRSHLRYRSGRSQPRRVFDLGLLPISYSSKVQGAAEDAVATERPKEREREEFGTEL